MRRPLLSVASAIALSLLAASCKPPTEIVRVKGPVSGPPDLAKEGERTASNRSFQLRAFHLNHIWSGAGYTDGRDTYRAKVTIWDYADDDSVVAELYFEDAADHASENPDPSTAPRPYRLHFPMAAMGPILNTLRNTNEPVFLYYYRGKWAVGTYLAEPVGAD